VSSEAVLQQQIRLALGQRDDIMLFRINVGKFRPIDGDQRRVIQSAPEGTPDLLGVIERHIDGRYIGQAFGIEVKSLKGRQRDVQIAFQRAWEKRGAIYILARSLEDVYRGLDIAP
jgi:hypothetical protein